MDLCCTAPWETKKTTELHDPSLTHVTLVDLSPSKTYNLRVFAINSVGMSETSNVLTITAKEAGLFRHHLCVSSFMINIMI